MAQMCWCCLHQGLIKLEIPWHALGSAPVKVCAYVGCMPLHLMQCASLEGAVCTRVGSCLAVFRAVTAYIFTDILREE
eukprot:SAG31_NODE_42661_length_270_cov_0.912281_1_plen_77_part_10